MDKDILIDVFKEFKDQFVNLNENPEVQTYIDKLPPSILGHLMTGEYHQGYIYDCSYEDIDSDENVLFRIDLNKAVSFFESFEDKESYRDWDNWDKFKEILDSRCTSLYKPIYEDNKLKYLRYFIGRNKKQVCYYYLEKSVLVETGLFIEPVQLPNEQYDYLVYNPKMDRFGLLTGIEVTYSGEWLRTYAKCRREYNQVIKSVDQFTDLFSEMPIQKSSINNDGIPKEIAAQLAAGLNDYVSDAFDEIKRSIFKW